MKAVDREPYVVECQHSEIAHYEVAKDIEVVYVMEGTTLRKKLIIKSSEGLRSFCWHYQLEVSKM